MNFKLPITPKENDSPVIPVSRWMKHEGVLTKAYQFRRSEDKQKFVVELMAYERQVKHNAKITIDENEVMIQLTTKDVNSVTELDKEYAKFSDVLFRDLAYNA